MIWKKTIENRVEITPYLKQNFRSIIVEIFKKIYFFLYLKGK